MKTRNLVLLSALLMVMFTSMASASTLFVTFNFSIPAGTLLPVGTFAPGPSLAVSPAVPKFNLGAGFVLTGVDFALNATVHSTATITNNLSTTNSSTFVNNSALLQLDDSFANVVIVQPAQTTFLNGGNALAGHETRTLSTTLTASATSKYDAAGNLISSTGSAPSNPIDISNYIGTGNVVIGVDGQTLTSIGGNNWTGSTATTADVTGSITYEYLNTPEPATLALIGSALIALVSVRRYARR